MGKTAIDIANRQTRFKISRKAIRKVIQTVLDALECPDGELSLVLSDDLQITVINRDYLHRDRPTNVIAFPMREGAFSDINPDLLGDVIISLETTAAEARHAGLSLTTRFCQLLVHGILHLFGYDHERDETDAAAMDAKSRELLKIIGQQSDSAPGVPEFIIDSQSPKNHKDVDS